jgi:hypothetical protein
LVQTHGNEKLNEQLVEHKQDELVKDVTAGVYAIGGFTDSSFVGVGSAGLRCSSGGGQPANKERQLGMEYQAGFNLGFQDIKNSRGLQTL